MSSLSRFQKIIIALFGLLIVCVVCATALVFIGRTLPKTSIAAVPTVTLAQDITESAPLLANTLQASQPLAASDSTQIPSTVMPSSTPKAVDTQIPPNATAVPTYTP